MSNASNGPNPAAVAAAKSAREELAKGLNALQGGPEVPPELLELAAPIAQSMGALHQIERTQGAEVAQHAQVALNNVRAALAQLQAQPQSHPAVAAAMEAVASSLGHVHALSKMGAQSFPPPAAKPVLQVTEAAPAPVHAAPAAQAAPPWSPPAQQAVPAYAAPAPIPAPAPVPAAKPVPAPQAFAATADPFASPAARPNFEPAAQRYNPPADVPVAAPPARPSNPVPAPPANGQMQVVNADLGANSLTNFYKGLAGNDIIDHGGLFISTYMVPKIGAPLRLKVSLPGGYEFEANAVVRWAREVSGVGDAPPGFGAQFTQISAEAKQLIYRYVRNREPLFYDDL